MVKVKEDLTGRIFGRLTVLKQVEDYIGPSGERCAQWLCECSCDAHNQVVVIGKNLKSKTRPTQSCGCLAKETASLTHKRYNQYKIDIEDQNGLYGIGYCHNTGKEFYFDMDDYDKIKDYCWSEHKDDKGYSRLQAIINGKLITMSHILGYKNCDHKDRNSMNNRKYNFRIATYSQNNMNQSISSNNTSGFVGVSWHKSKCKWTAYISINKKHTHLGDYTDKKDAIIARLQAEAKYYGEFAPQRHLFEKYDIKNNIEGDKQ